SLGVILYEVLTGRRPFAGSLELVLALVRSEPPPPPSSFRPDLDPRLEAVCLKALAKNPAERYASMAEFDAALDACQGADAPPAPVPRARTKSRRYWIAGAAAAVVLLLGSLLLLATVGQRTDSDPAAAAALQAKAEAETAWEQVKDLDRGQGVGQRLEQA